MKLAIQLLSAVLFSSVIAAQNTKTTFAGNLKNPSKLSSIHLENIDGTNILVPVDSLKHFSLSSDSLQKGFYTVDDIGIVYFNQGFRVVVEPTKDGGYVFKGTGAVENNALRTAKKLVGNYFPLNAVANMFGEFKQPVYYMGPADFERKLDSFQTQAKLLFNKSTDTFFQKYAALDLDFYAKSLLTSYFQFYGYDQKKFMEASEAMAKLDPKAPDYMKKLTSFASGAFGKQLAMEDRMRLAGLVFSKWDKENEILFRNSPWYRKAFDNFFTFASAKYLTDDDLAGKPTEPNIKKLSVVRGELKNPFIRDYFDHRFTKEIIKSTKDTALLNKYYTEYLSRNPKLDYLQDVAKIYNAAITYTDNKPAPAFSFKNVAGKNVTLESFKGKFVYIDVWATCRGCTK